MAHKLKYLEKILKVYGFNGIFDFETIVEKDDAMEKRMMTSGLLEWDNYEKLMKCYGKRIQGNKLKNKFSVNLFTKLCDAILNEYGIGIKCKKKCIRNKNKFIYNIRYNLIETRQNVARVCKNIVV